VRTEGLALIVCLLAIPPVQAADWRNPQGAGQLTFTVSLEGETVSGRFTRFQVDVSAPEDAAERRMAVSVETASLDLSSRELNEGAAEADFFDTARFPDAAFYSEWLQGGLPGQLVAQGTLRIKTGIRPLDLHFEWSQSAPDQAQIRGAVTLRRGDYGIGSGEWVEDDSIGQDVRVEFDVPLVPVD